MPRNVSIAHFGALRGTNKYEDCETIFITGRNQPPPYEVDGLARAIWWRDNEPLKHDEAAALNADPATDLPHELRGYSVTDPSDAAGIHVRCFSDPRIEAVHQLFREAETIQALARLRLIRAKTSKHVYILSNLPVDIPIDHLVSWDEIMPSRLDRVLEQDDGIALSPKGLYQTRPDAFETEKAAERARSRELGRVPAPYETTDRQLARVIVRFRQARDGKPFGRVREHLFRIPYTAQNVGEPIVAPIPLDRFKDVLENGPSGNGQGWGPVVIEGIDYAPPPKHLVPIEANEKATDIENTPSDL